MKKLFVKEYAQTKHVIGIERKITYSPQYPTETGKMINVSKIDFLIKYPYCEGFYMINDPEHIYESINPETPPYKFLLVKIDDVKDIINYGEEIWENK